jgi:DNA-binding SARP family transcriptional activator
VRIRALGPLEVERDGERVADGRHGARKTTELLRLLVAHGGREVAQDVVADALWPDADADAALHALETTVYRLRRVVGPDVVVVRNRHLSLARERCWVDVHELEELLAAGSATRARATFAHLAGEAPTRIAALYRGPLLADARDTPWTVEARERLRRKLLRWVDTVESRRAAGASTLRQRLAAADPALEKVLRILA